MRNVKAWVRVEFFAELPDNDGDADAAFDDVCDTIDARLNAMDSSQLSYALPQSFSVADGDTEPDE